MPMLIEAQVFEGETDIAPPPPQQAPSQDYINMVRERGCLRALEALYIAGCIANPGAAACQTIVQPSNLFLLGMPLCEGDLPALPPSPSCLDSDIAGGVAYCQQYGVQGPEPIINAACWGIDLVPGELDRLAALPPCETTTTRTTRTREERPERITIPETGVPMPGRDAETPTSVIEETPVEFQEYELPVEEEKKPSSALYVVGGILIVAVLGTGMYFATRK